MRQTILTLIAAHIFLLSGDSLMAEETLARWSFDQLDRSSTLEEVSKQPDPIVGFYDPVAGIGSGAIQLDGYTSFLERAKFSRSRLSRPKDDSIPRSSDRIVRPKHH